MDTRTPEEPLVPPVLDQAELLGSSATDFPVIQAEPEEGLTVPLDTAEQQQRLLLNGGENASPGEPPLTLPALPSQPQPLSEPAPAPLHLPPPAPPGPPPSTAPTDSLSLAQLQNLVRGIPKVEPAPYAFTYDDASLFEEEIEEWFSYAVEEQAMLLKTQTSFASLWTAFNEPLNTSNDEGELDWDRAATSQQNEFVVQLLKGLKQSDPAARLKNLEAIVYVLLGCWHETAGIPGKDASNDSPSAETAGTENPCTTAYEKAGKQVLLIKQNVKLLAANDGIETLVGELRTVFLRACGGDVSPDDPRDSKEAERREVWCAMTAVYIVLEVARTQEKVDGNLEIRNNILGLQESDLLTILIDLVARLRWDESISLPLNKISLLLWKTMLVVFGGLAEVDKAKSSFQIGKPMESTKTNGQPLITASPLDYHLFRQEISSKYPAYNPPPPLFPLEPENNSILPPLKNHPNKVAGNHVFGSGLGDTNGKSTSILHQPVHIATPAPSPPPSPAGPGGKGGKKQNYQTNQMFPFLYPPLDESSNKLGGKGSTDLQDLLVGRKWEGSDIPASILEAAELFAKRMKATRAMKQLWEERVAFMKYERGWTGSDDRLDEDELSLEPKEGEPDAKLLAPGSIEQRLDLVEQFYVSGIKLFCGHIPNILSA